MEKLVIKGGTKLKGDVVIGGAKNAAVAILPATLLINGICKIDNLPSAYPKSTTEAYSSNAKEWIIKILDNELQGKENSEVVRGKIFDKGKISHQVIKEHWDYYEKNNI